MIKSRHRPFFTWFFRVYSIQMIRLHFRKVAVHGEFLDKGLPVMLIGNHFSWWDGFISNFLNNTVFHRKFHVMMLEEQLNNRMFLNKAGAYSIKRGSRSVIESMQYTVDLLSNAENLVVLYPQGVFESQYQRPVRFEKGVCTIAARVTGEVQLVFYAALVDYFSSRKPSLSVYLREVPREIALAPGSIESAYNTFLSECTWAQKPE